MTRTESIIAENPARVQVLDSARQLGFGIDSSEDGDVIVKNHHGIQTVLSMSWGRVILHEAVVRVNGRKMATVTDPEAVTRWIFRTA